MNKKIRPCAHAAVLSGLMLVSACGGGGGGGDSPPAPSPPANRAPTLTSSTVSTSEDVTSSTQLVATDPDNNALTFALASNPQHGTATLSAAGVLSYVPASNYSGADSLTVTVNDGAGGQATGTINITITAVNDLPVLTTTSLAVDEDSVLTAQLAGTDAESDAFTFQFVASAAHGTVTSAASGALTYTPAANYSGADQIRVKLVESASTLASAEQVVNIQVRAINDPPVVQDDTLRVTATPGQPVVVPALANDSDVDGDTLTPTVVTQPRGGTMTVNAATKQLTFEPANGYVGPIDFTYRVNDGHVDSAAVSVHAVIGSFEPIIFLSDYTTPGRAEVHVFDGLEVRRVSDTLPTGYSIVAFSVSGDLRTMALTVDGANDMRAYVQPMDGSSAAVLRYSTPKTAVPYGGLGAYLNSDGSYLLVYDYYKNPPFPHFVVNLATGATTQLGANMAGLVATKYANFHPFDPKLIVIQGQTAGPYQPDIITSPMAKEMYIADAANPGTLTQIGHNHSLNEYGGEGYYFSRNTRTIYYGEYRTFNGPPYVSINFLAYDRDSGIETPVVRYFGASERGINGVGWGSPDASHMCFSVYEPTTTAYDGPSRFYAMDMANPASAKPVSPVLSDTSQCTIAPDNRTVIYRIYALNRNTQHAYAVDSVNPGTPVLLAPNGEAGSKQGTWQASPGAMRMAIAYFDNDGNPYTTNQVGRYYSLPLDGSGSPFLFSDNYRQAAYTTWFYDSNDVGSFMIYGRPNNGIAALELMSTRGLNLSIPLSRAGETIGVKSASWLRRYPP